MNTRKSKTFPILIAVIFIVIIVYLFMSIKQTEVICSKTYNYDSNIRLSEELIATTDGKKITHMTLTKTIILPEKYADETHKNSIKYALENTLNYLGDKVKYTILDDRIIVSIDVSKDEVLLLSNIEFYVNEDLEIKINSNTKSSDVVTLSVGDSYNDGELMKRMRNNGYACK